MRSAPAASTRRTAFARLDRSASRTLAATRARPSPISDPPGGASSASFLDTDGQRLPTALAAEGRGTGSDETFSATSDGGRRRLACMLGRQLTACRADLLPAVAPDGDR